MEFRRTIKTDVDYIMKIIVQAQDYLKEQGVDQWQDGYPNEEVINSDIDHGYGYVFLKEDDIVATAAVSFDG